MPISHGHTPFKYNRYVAPESAEDVIEVANLKQNLYTQGKASIEAKMESLAGFDIAREQDRIYANQELSKIYEVMQKNASKDFSNPQIVKSFLDVAKPLENDPIFKNATASTNELRRRQTLLSDLKTKNPGQYNIANEEEFMTDVQKWMEDPSPGAVLNSKDYMPWTDVSKKVTEGISKIQEEVSKTKKKDGSYFSSEEVKEISEERIKSFLSTFTPQEKNQIQIDSNYTARHTSTEEKWKAIGLPLVTAMENNLYLSTIEGIENSKSNKEFTTQEGFRQKAKANKELLDRIKTDEDLLNQMYANQQALDWEEGIAKTYSYKSVLQDMIANPVAMQNQRLAAQVTAAELAFTREKQILEMKTNEDIRKAKETGEIIQDINGNWVPNPAAKSQNEKAVGYTERKDMYLDESLLKVNREDKDMPLTEEQKLLNNQLQQGTLTEPIDLEYDELSPAFNSKIIQKMKELGADADAFKDDFTAEFIPVEVEGKKRIKIVVNENAALWGQDESKSFFLDELGIGATTSSSSSTTAPKEVKNAPISTEEGSTPLEVVTSLSPTNKASILNSGIDGIDVGSSDDEIAEVLSRPENEALLNTLKQK